MGGREGGEGTSEGADGSPYGAEDEDILPVLGLRVRGGSAEGSLPESTALAPA